MRNIPKKKKTFSLFIQSNSPGEITAWVKPIVQTAQKQNPNCHITLLLTPCQYASGKEVEVAKNISGIDQIYTPSQTIKLLFSWPWFSKQNQPGAILFLGGDLLYAKLFGLKYRLPVYAYTQNKIKKSLLIRKIFSRALDGDLMAERTKNFSENKTKIFAKHQLRDQDYCLFMCGSRPQHFFNFLPIITETVQCIKKRQPSFQAILLVSPFIHQNDFTKYQKKHDLSDFIIISQPANSLELISIAKLVVTIPGTNNMEIAYLQKPAIVVFPLNHPEHILTDGLLCFLGKIPLLNLLLQKIIISIVKRKKRYFSLPNEIAKQYIYPEIVEKINPSKLADTILKTYHDNAKLTLITKKLTTLTLPTNPAQTICQQIFKGQ